MSLQELRDQIDKIDEQIINLLVVRNEVITQVAQQKEALSLPTLQIGREEEVLQKLYKYASQKGLSGQFTTNLFKMIMDESKRIQDEKRNK